MKEQSINLNPVQLVYIKRANQRFNAAKAEYNAASREMEIASTLVLDAYGYPPNAKASVDIDKGVLVVTITESEDSERLTNS